MPRTTSWTCRRGWCGLSCKTAGTLQLAWGVHFFLLVGVAVADVALEMMAGLVRFVVRDGVFVALAWGMQLVLLAGVAEADCELDVVAKVMGLVVYDGVHVAACVGCAAGASCRRG